MFGPGLPRARSIARYSRCSVWVLSAAALCAGRLALAEDPNPTAPQAQAPNVDAANAYRSRRASRPKAALIQTDVVTASKTEVKFQKAPELAYQSFNDLVVQTGTFANGNANGKELPGSFELLCYNGQPVGPTI